jgi:organic radical activating enzyme
MLLIGGNVMYKLPVLEIFSSIQGEGYHMGKWTMFIRLAGCNLKCPWCDTKDIMQMAARDLTVDDIVKIVAKRNASVVTITGGEPTIHDMEALSYLIYKLQLLGKYVTIETNGTNPTPANVNWVTCSPKPGNDYKIHSKCRYNELKYVVDETFAPEYITTLAISRRVPIYVQPEGMKPENIRRCLELVQHFPFLTLGVQLHKVLGVQ